MDRERVMARVEQLLKEKHMSMNALMPAATRLGRLRSNR